MAILESIIGAAVPTVLGGLFGGGDGETTTGQSQTWANPFTIDVMPFNWR